MTAKLYCFAQSGNAYKVALMLAVSGHPWEPVLVDFFNGGHRAPDFLALNPMGEVPLYVEGDLALSQSGAILSHLAEVTGKHGGTTPEEKREILRWLLWDNHKFTATIAIHRFLTNFLPAHQRQPDVIAFHAARQKSAMKVLERHLANRQWVVGTGPTIADFSLCGYLYYPEDFGFDRAEWPHVDAWLNCIAALPGWQHPHDLMPGHPAGGQ